MTPRTTRVRDPESTRAAVLQEATRVFAELGFSGASLREISERSGVSKPVIYYHFGSKEGLYSAVKQRLLDECNGSAPAPPRLMDPEAEVRRLFEELRGHKTLIRICAWARLEGDVRSGLVDMEAVDALQQRLALAREQGAIRGDIEPGYLTIMLVGLVAFWLEVRSRAEKSVGGDPDDSAYLRQVAALLTRGLSND